MSELLDTRADRIRTLAEVVRGLHAGEDPEAVADRLRGLVRRCEATEIAGMEQELLAGGMPVAELAGMCDLHARVAREVLVALPPPVLPPGHPVDVFRRENAALLEKAAALRSALDRPGASGARLEARILLGELLDVEKHYARKENLLFPILERHGITGPSQVMWAKDDEVRALLRDLGEALKAEDVPDGAWAVVADTLGRAALDALEEMVRKEETILLPMSLQHLAEGEWGEVWSQSPAIGWCLVEPEGTYRPSAAGLPVVGQDAPAARTDPGALMFPTGALTFQQLQAIFSALPVDVTFVDADDRVRFFSEGPDRIFLRPKAAIGRLVQNCHPPASVGTVERILTDFRTGARDAAEFWIDRRGRFVHIRYLALRDASGAYLGTLEVTQDLTRERALTGERRLLEEA